MFSRYSPYYETDTNAIFIEYFEPRNIPADSSDYDLEITSKYHERPGQLAYDLFGTRELWWVFITMNRDLMIDPIYDLKTGMTIRVPVRERILELLG